MTLENKLNKLKNEWNITKNRFINSYPNSKFNKNDTAYIASEEKLDQLKKEIEDLYHETNNDIKKMVSG